MLPWFLVTLVDVVSAWFGFQVYVTAKSGSWWGPDRIHFVRDPNAGSRARRIKVR